MLEKINCGPPKESSFFSFGSPIYFIEKDGMYYTLPVILKEILFGPETEENLEKP